MGMPCPSPVPSPRIKSYNELVQDVVRGQFEEAAKKREAEDIDRVLRGEPDSHDQRAAKMASEEPTDVR